MRKPRGGQIRANRLIGPRKVLGEGDRRVPAKGRGRTAPYRGRSGLLRTGSFEDLSTCLALSWLAFSIARLIFS